MLENERDSHFWSAVIQTRKNIGFPIRPHAPLRFELEIPKCIYIVNNGLEK